MKYVYDNGYKLLGDIYHVKNYIASCINGVNEEEDKEKYDLIKELENYDDDTIVVINYDFGMGLSFDTWNKKDIIEKEVRL